MKAMCKILAHYQATFFASIPQCNFLISWHKMMHIYFRINEDVYMTSLSGSYEMYRKRDVTHFRFQSIIRSLYNLWLYSLHEISVVEISLSNSLQWKLYSFILYVCVTVYVSSYNSLYYEVTHVWLNQHL